MTDEKDELEVFFEGEDHPISTEPEKAEVEPTQVETESETTAEETPSVPEGYAPIAALQDERRKTQQAREEAEALRKQVPVKDEAPDPYEDIEKYDAFQRQKWEKELFVKQEGQRRKHLDDSRSKMLEQYDDYDEMERIFSIMTAEDTTLVDKMYMSGNEAKFAYDTAKEYKESLLKQPEPVEIPPITEVPNLAKATAQAANTPQVEQEATIEDIFADQEY